MSITCKQQRASAPHFTAMAKLKPEHHEHPGLLCSVHRAEPSLKPEFTTLFQKMIPLPESSIVPAALSAGKTQSHWLKLYTQQAPSRRLCPELPSRPPTERNPRSGTPDFQKIACIGFRCLDTPSFVSLTSETPGFPATFASAYHGRVQQSRTEYSMVILNGCCRGGCVDRNRSYGASCENCASFRSWECLLQIWTLKLSGPFECQVANHGKTLRQTLRGSVPFRKDSGHRGLADLKF